MEKHWGQLTLTVPFTLTDFTALGMTEDQVLALVIKAAQGCLRAVIENVEFDPHALDDALYSATIEGKHNR